MKSFLFLVALMIMTSLVAAAATCSELADSSYRLRRLVVQNDDNDKGAGEADTSPPPYVHENAGDADHLYLMTIAKLDSGSEECLSTDAVAYQFSMRITNRFRATACLTPSSQHDSSSSAAAANGDTTKSYYNRYNVKIVGRVSSTRMMPLDDEVRQLERQFETALAAVTAAEVTPDNLFLSSGSDGRVQILLQGVNQAELVDEDGLE